MDAKTRAMIDEARKRVAEKQAAALAASVQSTAQITQLPEDAASVQLNGTQTSNNEAAQTPPAPQTLHLSATSNHSQIMRGVEFNPRQLEAIEKALQAKSFGLIGAAGTGKTTVTQEIIARLQQSSHMQPLSQDTKHLNKGAPSIVICGFTNKAVNNIRKKLPAHLQSHCITIHKLLEYAPVWYETINDEGKTVKTMVFEPTRNSVNPLPHICTIIFEESSMIGTDLYGEVVNALPHPQQTQMIFLGDLNQIPPVFGPSILGFKLAELPVVELTHVYRQALQSPIISLATAIRTDYAFMPEKDHPAYSIIKNTAIGATDKTVSVDCGEDGKLTLHIWKERVDKDYALAVMKGFIPRIIEAGVYNPAEDMILCPFNKSFGTVELNKIIADYLAKKRNAVVWEVRARWEVTYWAVGDRVMVDRHEAIITKIEKTIGYAGKPTRQESTTLDRWGNDTNNPAPANLTPDQIMDMMEAMGAGEEGGKNLASHSITVLIPDTGEEKKLTTAGEINSMLFGWVLTIHKSQGSEWQKVFLFLHESHATMVSRELIYTGITRAKHELYIIMEGDTVKKGNKKKNQMLRAAERPVIPGTLLSEKIEYFKGKAKEMGSLIGEQD